jgi:4-amino-4-deoxy-L-arabinose transferase-like glycosyltransferase
MAADEFTASGKQSRSLLLPVSLTVAGLLARLAWAHSLFLNADEALHYLLSKQPSLALTYKASLTTVHPPLLILLLHYWSWFGTSEFVLRLPSVLAGTAFCWLMYLWLERVADEETALIGLSLLLFCPALIYVSAEIRQYALLMFFLAGSLYCLERALQEDSPTWMLVSFLSLLLGVSTHYSSLILALALGVYALLRFRPGKTKATVFMAWIAGELAALALVAFYVISHVLPLERVGFPQTLADSYLRGSIFHRGEDHVIPFIFRTNIKVFHYLFSQGAVGVLGLLLFLLGVILLFRSSLQHNDTRQPTPRQLAWLLILPFVVNCATAVAGAYPYGGTRHNSYLAGFAMSGVAIAIARWRPERSWAKPAALAAGLAICNFTVLPGGVYMKPRNQRIALMRQAMTFVDQSVPKRSMIVTDLEGGLALGYYLCHNYALQFQPPFQPFYKAECGDYQLISQDPRLWIFRAQTFATDMQTLQRMYGLGPDTKVWLFQAGFVVDKEPDLRAVLRQYGCMRPHEFGQNIFLCEMTPGKSAKP